MQLKKMIMETVPARFDGRDCWVMWHKINDEIIPAINELLTNTPPNEPERAGLYGKYTVYKNKDGSLVTDCFILRPAKDPAAVAALRAYAAATDNAELAADIINWVGAEPNEPLYIERLIKQLRRFGGELGVTPLNNVIGKYMLQAADALEELQKSEQDNVNLTGELAKVAAELKQVKAERDAAIEDIHKLCPTWQWDGKKED